MYSEYEGKSEIFLVPSPKIDFENNGNSKIDFDFINLIDDRARLKDDDIPFEKLYFINSHNEKDKDFLEIEKENNKQKKFDKMEEEELKNNNKISFINLINKLSKKPDQSNLLSNISTNDKSKQGLVKVNKCLFGINFPKKIEPRIDYSIKNFKVGTIKFAKDFGNELIKKCNFTNKLRKMKLFSPSYKYFTGNSNIYENINFLNFSMEKIFSYPEGKIEKNDNRLQRQNKEIINSFKEYIEKEYLDEVPENYQNLINFFSMSFKDIIILFYESNHFGNFSTSPKTRFLDEQFIKSKDVSLLEKNGFLKFLNNYNKGTNINI